jgi:hypothetical protein
MRIALRILCWSSPILAVLACDGAPEKPCLPADAAAGRCKAPPAKRFELPPGAVLPDWAVELCRDWHHLDGSCDALQIMADWEECLAQQGLPEQQRLREQGVGNRTVNRARERATHNCMELRRWVMKDDAQKRWIGLPPDHYAKPPS